MVRKTPLYAQHLALDAQMVHFAGWQMPLHYGSQLTEHQAVREHAGLFDVSHMGIIDITGAEVVPFLRFVLANDIKKLDKNGRSLYTCLLNTQGGILDDLIVYRLADQQYRLVVNASRREADLAWLKSLMPAYRIRLQERIQMAIIAVQGPEALAKLSRALPAELMAHIESLRPFRLLLSDEWQIARTGYTGEDGVEIILPALEAPDLWKKLLQAGVTPCGLGARDTLRLEAGLDLYGADMDDHVSPLEANLEWTVDWLDSARNFMGRAALVKQKQQGVQHRLVGLMMEGPGVLRNHQRVWIDDQNVGEVTSGGFSPTLNCGIAMARIPVGPVQSVTVERRGKQLPVQIVTLPFVRHGKKVFEIEAMQESV